MTTLKGSPSAVGQYFNCYDCTSLESLKGAPYVYNKLDCHGCSKLPEAEIELAKTPYILNLWLEHIRTEYIPAHEWIVKHRGTITGHKYNV